MNLVILVAGKNTRLDRGIPKSLLTLKEETLLSRHIRIFKKYGINKFCIITGYRAEKVEEALVAIRKTHQVDISVIYNDRFDLENGFSVFKAKEWVEKNKINDFFLTMGDHIFDSNFVAQFIEKSANSQTILQLAIDTPSEFNVHIDIEDVTKVQIDNKGFIEAIGKSLITYNKYDTGLFRLKSTIYNTFQESFAEKKYTISDSIEKLIATKNAKSVLIEELLWNDVDNAKDLQKTIKLFYPK